MLKSKIVCEIGCGDKKILKDSICIDIRKTSKVDIIADARMLPLKDGSIDYIYSSHVIEHFSHNEVKGVCQEWIRTLKQNGIFELRCPDFRARSLLFFIKPSWENVTCIYGEQDYPANYHKCCFSYKLLKDLLIENGIINVKRVYDGYKGIPFIPSDLHVKGNKLK